MLESELIGDTIGKLNIINVVTTDNILIPWYIFILAYLTLVTADSGWDTVVLVHPRFFVFLLVLLSCVMLEPQERILVHCWYSGDAAGKTDVDKGVMGTAVKQNERSVEETRVFRACGCGTVLLRCFVRTLAQSTVFLSVVSSI